MVLHLNVVTVPDIYIYVYVYVYVYTHIYIYVCVCVCIYIYIYVYVYIYISLKEYVLPFDTPQTRTVTCHIECVQCVSKDALGA